MPVLYSSDTGVTPYGRLPAVQLAARVRRVLRAMAAQGVTHAVVACNAASTILPGLGDVGLPVMGVIEPAIAMVSSALEGVLGVVGGARTIRSGRIAAAPGHAAWARDPGRSLSRCRRTSKRGAWARRPSSATSARILPPLARVDTLLLACTHYPSAQEAFRRLAPRALLLDPAEAVVEALIARWRLPRGRGDSSS